MALGAGRQQVLALIVRDALRLVGVGLLLGLSAAVGVQRLSENIVFGIRPGNPIFLVVACGVMVLTSLAAAYLPARRAAAVDPVQALRSE
jgi:ABC-type antimicrobial peptide transport system permease subunit